MRRWWPVLFLALVPLLPLWRAVFGGEAIGAFDQIRQMAPWNQPAPVRPWDVLQADSVLQFYPWRDMVFDAWGKGQLPLWNRHQLAGTPLLANSQSAGFYPLHIVMGIAHVPTPVAMKLLAWFHLFWAGLGIFLLARRLGASGIGAAIGGASFSLSAFMVAWTALPSVITTVAWIPWCLWAVTGLFAAPTAERDEEQPKPKGAAGLLVVLALCVAMMLLAGHLQFAAYGLMAIALWTIVSLFTSQRRLVGLAATVVAVAMGAMLAAPQLLPVLKYSEFSHRRNAPSAEGYQAYLAGAIKPFELATLVNPVTLGDPTAQAGIQGLEGASEYWPPYVKQGANFAESAVWLGPLVLGLLILAPWKDRRLLPAAVLGSVALLLALGTVLNWPLYFYAPGWSSTGSLGRVIVLFLMAACVLAALGWTRLPTIDRRLLFAAIGVPAVVGLLLHFLAASLAPAAQQGMEQVTATLQAVSQVGALPMLLLLLVVGCGLLLLGHAPASARYRPAAVLGPVALATIGFALSYVPTGAVPTPLERREHWLSPGPRVAVINEGWSIVAPAKAFLPPNSLSWYRGSELGGYDSLLHRDTKALLDDINGGDSAPLANGNMMFVKPSFDPVKLADAGVQEVWSTRPLSGLGEPAMYGRPYLSYTLPGKGPMYIENGGVVYSPNWTYQSSSVVAPGPGKLTVKERVMPGWTATIDGKPAVLEPGIWREVELPEGEHLVTFNYTPPGMTLGLVLMFVAVLICGTIGVFSVVMPKLGKTEPSEPKLTS